MAEQLIDKSLKKIKFLFRILGMNIEDRPKKWSEIFIFTSNFLWLGTDTVGIFSFIYKGVLQGRNFIELTHVATCVTLGLTAHFKVAFQVVHEKKIHHLVNNIRDMETKRLAHNPLGRNIARGETNFLYSLITIMSIVNFMLVLLFNFGPLVVVAVKYFKFNDLELILPFFDIYPVNCYDLKIWPLAYLHQIWTCWLVLANILTVDFLFYICCTHIGVQFKLLQHEVEAFITDKRMVQKKLTENTQFLGKFNDLVKWHQAIISSANLLEEIYAESTLFNYLTSSLVICLTGFIVTAVDSNAIVVMITFATIFCVGMMQIFFLCFFGDMLMNASTCVSLAAYNCKWYLADVTVGKSALIMQTRAQKPCKLTAAGYADVNLNAFMKILSSSWSYFALLQTVYMTIRD